MNCALRSFGSFALSALVVLCCKADCEGQTIRAVALTGGSSTSFNNFFRRFGLNNSGDATFFGGFGGFDASGISAHVGVFAERNGLLVSVAADGELVLAPEPSIILSISESRLGDDAVAYEASSLALGSQVARRSVFVDNLNGAPDIAIASQFMIAPGAGGATFSNPGLRGFNADGDILIESSLSNGEEGIFVDRAGLGLQRFVLTGSSAVGIPSATYEEFFRPRMNERGQVAFAAVIDGAAITSDSDSGIWSETGNAGLRLIAREGSPIPGSSSAFFGGLTTLLINNNQETAFFSTLRESVPRQAFWIDKIDTGPEIVARTSDLAPGTPGSAVFTSFDSVDFRFSDAGIVFGAETGGLEVSGGDGFWGMLNGESLSLIAFEGQAAPGAEVGVVFSDLLLSTSSGLGFALGDRGEFVFGAVLSGPGVNASNDRGLWMRTQSGVLQLVAREGQVITIEVDGSQQVRTIQTLSFFNDDKTINFSGDVLFRAGFTDSTRGLLVFSPGLQGDFNNDGVSDDQDIDFYSGNIENPATGDLARLDLDGDGTVTLDDHDYLVTRLIDAPMGSSGTFIGDINIDGRVDVLGDAFILVGNLGSINGTWSTGDLNADGQVDVLGDAFRLVMNLGSQFF